MKKLHFDGMPDGDTKPHEFCKKCGRIHDWRVRQINEQWFNQFVETGRVKDKALYEAKTASQYWERYWKGHYVKKLEAKKKEYEKKLAEIESMLAADYPIWHE